VKTLIGICFTIFLMMFYPNITSAQDRNVHYYRINTDFMLMKTFKNRVRYFGEAGLHTLLKGGDGWFRATLFNDFHYNIIAPVDVIAGLHMNYTEQTDTTDAFNTFEFRPWIGTRLHLTPNAKIMVSNLLRYEQRFLVYRNKENEKAASRIRNRLEFTWSVNQPNFFYDDLWYITFDAEYFWPLDDNPDERFANLAQLRIGVGYRMSYQWRFVLRLNEQFSRNTIDEEFSSSSLIVNLRIHYFIPAMEPD
jgi:hypothetical protein